MSERQMAEHLIARIDDVRAGLPDGTLGALLERLRVTRLDAAPPNGRDGLYFEGTRTLFVNPGIRTHERRRFTAYHEATHAIVADDDTLREELAELCPDDEAERRVVEMLCNVGAAEFLLPRARFVPFLRGFDPPLACLATLADEFPGVSLPAAAQQIAQYSTPEGMVLICADDAIPCEGGWQRARRHVQYAFIPPWAGTGRRRPRPRRYQILRSDHPLAGMFDSPQPFSGDSYYPYDTERRIPCWCEAAWHEPSQRAVGLLTERRSRLGDREQLLLLDIQQ